MELSTPCTTLVKNSGGNASAWGGGGAGVRPPAPLDPSAPCPPDGDGGVGGASGVGGTSWGGGSVGGASGVPDGGAGLPWVAYGGGGSRALPWEPHTQCPTPLRDHAHIV